MPSRHRNGQYPLSGLGTVAAKLVGGEVDVVIDSLPVLLPAFKAGLIKIVAIGAPVRLADMPDIPSLAEAGFGNLEFLNWFGIFAPPRTATPIIARLNRALDEVLALPDVRSRLDAWALQPMGGPAQDFAKFVARDRKQREVAIGAILGHRCT
jgi:tripartite-type tricarboxylate transporter receptor subunit TctC